MNTLVVPPTNVSLLCWNHTKVEGFVEGRLISLLSYWSFLLCVLHLKLTFLSNATVISLMCFAAFMGRYSQVSPHAQLDLLTYAVRPH